MDTNRNDAALANDVGHEQIQIQYPTWESMRGVIVERLNEYRKMAEFAKTLLHFEHRGLARAMNHLCATLADDIATFDKGEGEKGYMYWLCENGLCPHEQEPFNRVRDLYEKQKTQPTQVQPAQVQEDEREM